MTHFQIQQMVVRMSDGDNVTLDDAVAQVSKITGFAVEVIQDIMVKG